MNDRELLELAAKAAGYQIEGDADYLVAQPERFGGGFSIYNNRGGSQLWNPLTDDGDALRLAVKLCLTVSADSDELCVWRYQNPDVDVCEQINNDPYAATRRAIVRAAAEIGKEMK